MNIVPGNAQHSGRRDSQQDEFWFSDIHDEAFIAHGGVLALVADGMGGLERGGEASQLAARVFGQAYLAKAPDEAIPEALQRALQETNAAVCELSLSVDEFHNVGTTLVAAVVAEQCLYWLSVGDSRLYLFHQGELTQLTHDHNYAALLREQVADGLLSAEEAESDPDRNALISYVGMPELAQIDNNLEPFAVEPGDWVLLCSDGLHCVLSKTEIVAELFDTPQAAAEALVRQVLSKNLPHQDNVTVAIMACQAEELEPTLRQAPPPRKKPWPLGLALAVLAMAAAGWWYWQPQPAPPPVPAEKPQDNPRITALMQQAEENLKANRYTEPAGDNALEKYRAVLALQADYAPAKEALTRMGDNLKTRAAAALAAGHVDEAQRWLNAAAKTQIALEPSNQLNEMQQRIDALRSPKDGAGKNKPKG
jgi:protein phosphatase